MSTTTLTPTLPARADVVAEELIAIYGRAANLKEVVALAYLQGRVEAALEMKRHMESQEHAHG